jgi:hypothetical protein
MTAARARTGFRLPLGTAMVAIALVALGLAPLTSFARAPTTGGIALAFFVELFVMPLLITLFLYRSVRPEWRRDRAISIFWIVMCAIYVMIPIVLNLISV